MAAELPHNSPAVSQAGQKLCTRDGKVWQVQRRCVLSAAEQPRRDGAGTLGGIGVHRDVAELGLGLVEEADEGDGVPAQGAPRNKRIPLRAPTAHPHPLTLNCGAGALAMEGRFQPGTGFQMRGEGGKSGPPFPWGSTPSPPREKNTAQSAVNFLEKFPEAPQNCGSTLFSLAN